MKTEVKIAGQISGNFALLNIYNYNKSENIYFKKSRFV